MISDFAIAALLTAVLMLCSLHGFFYCLNIFFFSPFRIVRNEMLDDQITLLCSRAE